MAIEGALVEGGEPDVLAFQAEAVALCRAEVTLGILSDSTLTLYDADGWELVYNDDQAESAASRLEWEAPDAETYSAVKLQGQHRLDGGASGARVRRTGMA